MPPGESGKGTENKSAADASIGFLNAPVKCVTAPHTPVPFSGVLERAFLPSAQDVLNAVGEMG